MEVIQLGAKRSLLLHFLHPPRFFIFIRARDQSHRIGFRVLAIHNQVRHLLHHRVAGNTIREQVVHARVRPLSRRLERLRKHAQSGRLVPHRDGGEGLHQLAVALCAELINSLAGSLQADYIRSIHEANLNAFRGHIRQYVNEVMHARFGFLPASHGHRRALGLSSQHVLTRLVHETVRLGIHGSTVVNDELQLVELECH
mmetsp:Transcript_391/g.940  ORF Transcript_391/g.940 Transcript_391/m.940 type:complete len:200 (+) Transcript_391:618-1217(+)